MPRPIHEHVRRNDGSASASTVLVMPVLLTLIMLVFQLALWWHAAHVVTTAAQRGAEGAQVEHGSVAVARTRAQQFLASAGRGLLHSITLDARRNGSSARVVIHARVVSVVPGIHPSVSGVADGPTERFLPSTSR